MNTLSGNPVEDFLINLAAGFAQRLLKRGGSFARDAALGDERERALRRVLERSFLHVYTELIESGEERDSAEAVVAALNWIAGEFDAAEVLFEQVLEPKPSVEAIAQLLDDGGFDYYLISTAEMAEALIAGFRSGVDAEASKHDNPLFESVMVAGQNRIVQMLAEALKRVQPSISITGNVSGANVLIGSQQTVEGNLNIEYVPPKAERACPKPPPPPDKFGGREERIQQIMARIKAGNDTAITAVHGLGGIGKTTLARVLAHRLHADKTFRAVLWADITRDPNASEILSGWVVGCADSAFNVGSFPSVRQASYAAKALLDAVIDDKCERCEPPRVLVVLDDVWDNGLEAARTLKLACPEHATVLITTRSENVASDLGAEPESLTYMTPDEAVEMLALYLPKQDKEALRRLGVALGGHALAMELAARRVRKEKRPGESDAERLDRCRREYEAGIPAGSLFAGMKLEQGEKKEDNLTVSLAYSYDTLNSDDQRRFRALGILAYDAAFDVELLAAVWDVPRDAVYDYADTLRLLSLLEIDGYVYRQHPLLRAYARVLLDRESEGRAVFGRYADHIIQISQKFDELPFEKWHTLTPHVPHIHAVGDALAEEYLSTETTDEVATARAGAFSWNIMLYLNYRREVLFTGVGEEQQPHRLAWFEMGLNAWRALHDHEREAITLNNIGGAWSALGEQLKALEYYEQSLPLFRAMGDRGGEAATLANIGSAWWAMDEQRKALEYYEQSLPLFRAVRDGRGEATALTNIGLAWFALGEPRKALEYYEQALPLCCAVGDRLGEATTRSNIGLAWSALGEQRKALEYYEQALPLRRAVGDRGGEAATLTNIGMAWSALGEQRKALEYYEQALPLYRAVGDRSGEATALNSIGSAWSALGEPRKAQEYYEQALPLHRAMGDRRGEATALSNIGVAWSDLGEQQQALEYCEQALPLVRTVGDRDGEASTLHNIGSAWWALGEPRKALEYYEQALPLRRAVGDRGREASTLHNIGSAWWALGELRKALEYYEKALPLRRAEGDRRGEAITLHNIGSAWRALGEQRKALEYYEQALPLYRAVGDRGGEAVIYHNISVVYHVLGDLDKAIEYLERCVELYEQIAHPDLESDRRVLKRLKRERDGGVAPSTLPPENVNVLARNTVAVKTNTSDKLAEWRGSLGSIRADFAGRGPDWAIAVAFADALLTVLDDQSAELPESNPYAPVVRQVVEAIEAYKRGDNP